MNNSVKANTTLLHFSNGALGKVLGIFVQIVTVVVLIKTLSTQGFGEYALLLTVTSVATSIFSAYSSSIQNVLATLERARFANYVWQNIKHIFFANLIFWIVILSLPNLFAIPFDSFKILENFSVPQLCLLIVATFFGGMESIQIVILTALGETLPLAKQQLTSKVITLLVGLTILFDYIPAVPLIALACGLIAGSIPGLMTVCKTLWVGKEWIGERPAQLAEIRGKFVLFFGNNINAALVRAIELNLIAFLGKEAGVASYVLLQKLLNPLLIIFTAGGRNLWPFLRKANLQEQMQALATARKLQYIGLLLILVVGAAVLSANRIIFPMFGMEEAASKMLSIMAVTQVTYGLWVGIGYNIPMAFNYEKRVFQILVVLTLQIMIVYYLAVSGLLDATGVAMIYIAIYMITIYRSKNLENQIFRNLLLKN